MVCGVWFIFSELCNICIFEPEFNETDLRAVVNGAVKLCAGVCAAFAGKDGAWRYVMASENIDMRAEAKRINSALGGRGGGSTTMIQGTLTATESDICKFFGISKK